MQDQQFFKKTKHLSVPTGIIARGEMGIAINNYDWSKTPLGDISIWPQSLKTSVNIMLNSQHPMFVAWGESHTFMYNDAYIQVLGNAKHPWALGKPFAEVWVEIMNICGPLIDKVFNQAEATYIDSIQLFMQRVDYLEETFYSFSYSPIHDEKGEVSGLFCPSTNITANIVSQRRLKTLNELAASTLLQKSIQATCFASIDTIAKNPLDIPFALLYLADDDTGKVLSLKHAAHIPSNVESISPGFISLDNKSSNIWFSIEGLSQLNLYTKNIKEMQLPLKGIANQSVAEVVILPICIGGNVSPIGALVLGVNPCKKLDEDYQTFFKLIARQIATAIQNAKSYEEEKKHAERLAELDRAKTTFFSNVSHEFRTPLTLMLGPLQDSLSDTQSPLDSKQRERQMLIHRNGSRLLKLVNTLLDFSRIEANRVQAIYEPTNMSQLTRDLASCFDSTMEKADLKYILDIDAIDDLVYIDKEMWEKIVFNLLSNAFKFTLSGLIKVSLKKISDKIEFRVEDTGIGIPEKELPKLFERFHRVENSRGRSFEGSGIGLALIKNLVELHGGTVLVESVENQGSKFIINIPLGCAHLPQEKLGKSRESYKPTSIGAAYIQEASSWLTAAGHKNDKIVASAADSETQDFSHETHSSSPKKYHILLADDSQDMRNYIKSVLSEEWLVDSVENGKQALESALINIPDLIISDVMMPEMNGIELIKALHENSKTKLIPIILLSARAGAEARLEGLNEGADDYLVKPFSAKELLARVKTLLESGRMRLQLEALVQQRTNELQEAYSLLKSEMLSKIEIMRKTTEQQTQLKMTTEHLSRQAEFISTLCHEIRNPLNAICIIVGFLNDKITNMQSDPNLLEKNRAGIEKLKDDLSSLDTSVTQLRTILDNTLELSRLECDKIEFNPTCFSLKSVFNHLELMTHHACEQKGLCLKIILPENDIYLKIDVSRFLQILNNLVSNAIKFTSSGSVTVSVSVNICNQQETELQITIKDTGIGMTQEELSRLFSQFTQANPQISSTYGGSGLGLVITKKLLDKMHGSIQVSSEKGKGTIFTCTVKCKNLSQDEKKDFIHSQKEKFEVPKDHLESRPQVAVNNVTILVAEDNQINQLLIIRLLKQKGYHCESAHNGAVAIEKVKEKKFDIILMDIEMPELSGIDATKKIREMEKSTNIQQIPIIALSGHTQDEYKQSALAAGCNDYLTKPINPKLLYDKIDQYVCDSAHAAKKVKADQPVQGAAVSKAVTFSIPNASLIFQQPINSDHRQARQESVDMKRKMPG